MTTIQQLYWSIWLTVLWAGWWVALAVAMMLPTFVSSTLGAVIPGLKTWVDVANNLVRVVAFIAWAFVLWVAFTPIVWVRNEYSILSVSLIADIQTASTSSKETTLPTPEQI